MTVKILYLISSCKYFLRIPTKTTFIFTESWKSYQLIRGHVVLFSYEKHMTLCAVGRFFCCHLLYLTTYLIIIKNQLNGYLPFLLSTDLEDNPRHKSADSRLSEDAWDSWGGICCLPWCAAWGPTQPDYWTCSGSTCKPWSV